MTYDRDDDQEFWDEIEVEEEVRDIGDVWDELYEMARDRKYESRKTI